MVISTQWKLPKRCVSCCHRQHRKHARPFNVHAHLSQVDAAVSCCHDKQNAGFANALNCLLQRGVDLRAAIPAIADNL